MVANFKEARAENQTSAYGPFLQTGHFAEQVTVAPPGGRERTITVKIVDPRAELEHCADVVESEVEEIYVKCLRDESADKGGIATAELGLRLWRADDDPDTPWACAGPSEARNKTATTWEVLFRRAQVRRIGHKQQ